MKAIKLNCDFVTDLHSITCDTNRCFRVLNNTTGGAVLAQCVGDLVQYKSCKGVLVAAKVPGNLKLAAEVPLSKVTNPQMLRYRSLWLTRGPSNGVCQLGAPSGVQWCNVKKILFFHQFGCFCWHKSQSFYRFDLMRHTAPETLL